LLSLAARHPPDELFTEQRGSRQAWRQPLTPAGILANSGAPFAAPDRREPATDSTPGV